MTSPTACNRANPGLDRGAALISNLCLVHCLALPLAALLVPAGLGAAMPLVADGHGPAWLHWAFLLAAVPLSAAALLAGLRRHGRRLPALVAAFGFGAMVAGAGAHGSGIVEPLLTVAGGLIIAAAHAHNLRLRPRAAQS
jgi:hypothetical protein